LRTSGMGHFSPSLKVPLTSLFGTKQKFSAHNRLA
jgi:hypothetical protein